MGSWVWPRSRYFISQIGLVEKKNVPAHFCGERQVFMTALLMSACRSGPAPGVDSGIAIYQTPPSVLIMVHYTKWYFMRSEDGVIKVGVKGRFVMD